MNQCKCIRSDAYTIHYLTAFNSHFLHAAITSKSFMSVQDKSPAIVKHVNGSSDII